MPLYMPNATYGLLQMSRFNDVLVESEISDNDGVYMGGGGDDLFIIYNGTDVINAGAGDDVIHLYGSDTTTIVGGRGDDTVVIHSFTAEFETKGVEHIVYDYPWIP